MNTATTKKFLTQAENHCAQRNVRLTPQRLEVLRLISLQRNAISAYRLLDLLRKSKPQAKPPTVYRALNFLLEQGFVHKVESESSYILCHLFDQPMHTSTIFICDRCGMIKEAVSKKVEKILRSLARTMEFSLHRNVIETHGVCASCSQLKAFPYLESC